MFSLAGLDVTGAMGDPGPDTGAKQQRGTCAHERHDGNERNGHDGRGSARDPRRCAAMGAIDEAQALTDEPAAAGVPKSGCGNGCNDCQKLDH
jgi:hypothetical protein